MAIYQLKWNASIGAFAFAQSGQPWEAWDRTPYLAIGGENSDSGMFVEPAGSRRSDSHAQLDLNYTQNVPLGRYTLQLIADVYNVFDNQTGYSIQPGADQSDVRAAAAVLRSAPAPAGGALPVLGTEIGRLKPEHRHQPLRTTVGPTVGADFSRPFPSSTYRTPKQPFALDE